MKYIYTAGPYREYRGYVFKHGQPTEITDRSTLELIKSQAGFVQVEEIKDEAQEIKAPPAPVLKGKECSKCHKLIPRGWYMHQKWCRGNNAPT